MSRPLWQHSATELAAVLARGESTAAEVARAHFERIDEVDGRIRAFTELFRDDALADAKASDERRRRAETRGPLDGVPVSIKECFDFAGRETTLGLPSWRGRLGLRDAAIVTLLREAGAVILGRTNLSQTMLYIEARNPLFGQTANPWSLTRSPGGSSGGEAAAIAAGMSPLGIGTDLGGSVRTPAHFCGICAFKPTLDRMPMRGFHGLAAGQETVRGTAGPLARTVDDLFLVLQSLPVRRAAELDARAAPVPWDSPDAVRLEGMRVGYYSDDGILPASRALVRAVDRAAAALRARGCDVVAFVPPNLRPVIEAYLGALSSDGGEEILAALEGGAVDPSLGPLRLLAKLPAAARPFVLRTAQALGQESLAFMLAAMGKRSVREFWQLTERLRSYTTELLDVMQLQSIDLLLCPPYATCAFPHGGSRNFTLASSYAMLFNATKFPAGTVPVTRVRENETHREKSRDGLLRHARAIDQASAGLPVGVQIAARPWRDDWVLAAMRAVQAEVSSDDEFPGTPVLP